MNCLILTTSAKTGYNVEVAFSTLAEAVAYKSLDFPKMTACLMAMPDIFDNPYAFLDYIIVRFSKNFGDEEMGMHMIRKQLEMEGIDFKKMSSEEALRMIERLVGITVNFKGEEEARVLRTEFMEAYKRCSWYTGS